MKLLLITDTHGHLDSINALARETGADAVIHAGDLGFYDEGSADRMTRRELLLSVLHSELPMEAKKEAEKLEGPDLCGFVRQHGLLGQLPQFLSGEKAFEVPVYAVWGNHEDLAVAEKFYRGEYGIPNFHVLHEKQSFHLGCVHLFGLGGNFLVGKKLFQKPLAGGGGKIWSTFSQYLELLKTVEANATDGERRLFVSHVSPGKEPFMTLMGACTRADWLISGHMGPTCCQTWNEFAIREPEEAMQRVTDRLKEIADAVEGLGEGVLGPVREDLERLEEAVTSDLTPIGRGQQAPRWYRDMLCINLPDAEDGYAVLTEEGGGLDLETCVRKG